MDIKEKQEEKVEIQPEQKSKAGGLSVKLSVGLVILIAGYVLFSALRNIVTVSDVEVFNTVFISVLMQAFPFMLVGVLISSFMHVFVPDEWVVRIFPSRYGLGYLTALFAGLFFPVCECAIIPVMHRLVKKGVAMPIAVTFMLSAPIINPISIISTLYAFPGQPEIALMRVCLGLLIALLTGLVMSLYGKKLPVLSESGEIHECGCGCGEDHDHGHDCCRHEEEHGHAHEEDGKGGGLFDKLRRMLLHAGDEFFSVGKYLVIGAFITSLIQTVIPRGLFSELGKKSGLSLLIMMLAAFLLSACSTSDAFIARGFLSRFSLGPVMGFMVFGPMMDIKNLLMLSNGFQKGFVIRLSLLIAVLNFFVLSILTLVFF